MAALPGADEIMYVEEVRAEAALLRSRLSRLRRDKDPNADEAALPKTWAALRE
jgi:hypothetical protein